MYQNKSRCYRGRFTFPQREVCFAGPRPSGTNIFLRLSETSA